MTKDVANEIHMEVAKLDDGARDDSLATRKYTPKTHLKLARKDMKHGISNTKAMLTLFKGLVGTGVLSLGAAYANSGLWGGIFMTWLVVGLNIHCLIMLVNCAHHYCHKYGIASMDYAEAMEACVLHGPKMLRGWSSIAKKAVNTCILITQFGFCCSYMVFVSQNLKQVVDHYTGYELNIRAYLAIMVLPFMLICMLRHLKHVSYFASISNVLYAIGLVLAIQYITRDLPPSSDLPAIGTAGSLPLAFGMVMFSFEAINLVLPLENQMYDPHALLGWNGVMMTTSITVGCIYCVIGFFGYIKFGVGAKIAGTITLNLPQGEPLYQATKVIFAMAVFLTYAIQFYVPMDVIRSSLQERFDQKKAFAYEYWARVGLVIMTALIAEISPRVDLFISLIGAVTCSALTLFFPPMIDILDAFGPDGEKAEDVSDASHEQMLADEAIYRASWKFKLRVLKNALIFAIGIIGMVSGTYASMVEIVDNFRKH